MLSKCCLLFCMNNLQHLHLSVIARVRVIRTIQRKSESRLNLRIKTVENSNLKLNFGLFCDVAFSLWLNFKSGYSNYFNY